MRILCIGASNTYGHDPRSYIGSRYPEDVRWTGRLGGRDVLNCGLNGMAVPREAAPYTDLIRENDSDLVIVMLGTNDLLEGRGAEETGRRMEAFLEAVGEHAKAILLIAPPRPKTGEWVQSEGLIKESEKLGELYRELADRLGCRFADAGEWDIDMTYDGVHFSPAGHGEFARKLEGVLADAAENVPEDMPADIPEEGESW